MNRVVLSFVSVLAFACASGGGARANRAPAGPIEGTYQYYASIPGQQVRGALRVLGDTMLVEPESDFCQPLIGVPDPMTIKYTCNGPGRFESLLLTLDRRNPAQFSKWRATYRVTKQREVCVQYDTRNGRQVCVRTQRESYEVTESRSGTLQVRRNP